MSFFQAKPPPPPAPAGEFEPAPPAPIATADTLYTPVGAVQV